MANATDAEKLSIAAKARTMPPENKEKPIEGLPVRGFLSIARPALTSSPAACRVRSQSWFCAEYSWGIGLLQLLPVHIRGVVHLTGKVMSEVLHLLDRGHSIWASLYRAVDSFTQSSRVLLPPRHSTLLLMAVAWRRRWGQDRYVTCGCRS